MIRVNLLPFRAARAKENIRRQISIFFLLILFILVALWYSILLLNNKLYALESDISRVKQEITLYKSKANRVTEIQKILKNLEHKLNVISGFKSLRRDPILLLDEMTQLVVPERMWITSLSTKGGQVVLKGVAFDNQTVADFMTRIEGSYLFSGVDLKSLQLKGIKDAKVKFFELICRKKVQKEKKTTAGKK